MYVRKKKNRSGSTSVVIVDKSSGKIRYLKTIGIGSDEQDISDLIIQGKKWIASRKGEQDMFLLNEQQREEKLATDYLLNEKDKSTVMNIIDTMLTRQKFQTFFEQNLQPVM